MKPDLHRSGDEKNEKSITLSVLTKTFVNRSTATAVLYHLDYTKREGKAVFVSSIQIPVSRCQPVVEFHARSKKKTNDDAFV